MKAQQGIFLIHTGGNNSLFYKVLQ